MVPTLGVTFTCQYEPVKAVAEALDQLAKEKGWTSRSTSTGPAVDFWRRSAPRTWCGISAFRASNPSTASGHKFGLAPLGVGWVIWREAAGPAGGIGLLGELPGRQHARHRVELLTTGGQIICQYYNFLRLGKEGYRKIHTACYETAKFIADQIEKLGPFEVIYDGNMNAGIPALCWKMKDGASPGFSLYDLADRLRSRGWQVPAYSLPPNRQDLVIQRILVRHGVSRDLGSLLLDDMTAGNGLLSEASNHHAGDRGGGDGVSSLVVCQHSIVGMGGWRLNW